MTQRNIILIIGLIFITQSCVSYKKVDNYDKLIHVEDIKVQKQLDKAVRTDYVFFFNKMINQRWSKMYGDNWDISK